ncbi:MAG: 2-hydroxyacid dehydrogenase [Planctomycetia bacterium]|nr:2-hydroxyacid dehydrogenase [Planctomycetia bacterium]
MNIAFFSTKSYDREFFDAADPQRRHPITYLEPRLTEQTASLAVGFPCVCGFVNDSLNAAVLETLAASGLKLLALRSAGFNHVDLLAADRLGIAVVRVPAYSPYAVAEHTVMLMLALNRHLQRAYSRVRDGNLSLEGLLGFDLRGRTIGIIGTGRIGAVVAQILSGFGCRLLASDPTVNPELTRLGASYVPLAELYAQCDIITLHSPLLPETFHLIGAAAISQMKPGVMLINTSRGGIVDTRAVIEGLKSGQVGALGIDVYEEEEGLFFQDLSERVIQDDVFARLLTFPNVIVTGHQAFFTREALSAIAQTTLANIDEFAAGQPLANQVTAAKVRRK